MKIKNVVIDGQRLEGLSKSVIILGEAENFAFCTFKNIVFVPEMSSVKIFINKSVLVDIKQEESDKKVIKIGGLYSQDEVPMFPMVLFNSCVFNNCILPFENLYIMYSTIRQT